MAWHGMPPHAHTSLYLRYGRQRLRLVQFNSSSCGAAARAGPEWGKGGEALIYFSLYLRYLTRPSIVS